MRRPLVCMVWPGQLPKPFFCQSGFACCLCVQVWTEPSGRDLQQSRAHENTNTNTNTEARAHEHFNTTQNSRTVQTITRNTTKNTSTQRTHNSPNKRTPRTQTAERRSGQVHEGRAGLFVLMQLGRKHETRRCSGVPNGAECLLLTNSRGSQERGKIHRDAGLCVPSDHRQKG